MAHTCPKFHRHKLDNFSFFVNLFHISNARIIWKVIMLIRKPLDICFACCCVRKVINFSRESALRTKQLIWCFPVALLKGCGTKTYGKCFSEIFDPLETQEQRNIFLISSVVVDTDLALAYRML